MTIEFTDSKEYLIAVERRKKIATFISDVLRPAKRALEQDKAEHDISVVQKFESRSYQLEAWDAVWQARADGKNKGLLHLATGLGKTSVAVFDYAKFRSEQAEKGQPARALFVVHQNNILDQAKERFEEVLPNVSTGFFRNSQSELPSTDITFASFQSLTRGINKLPADQFDYIVYDEAHHIEATTYKTVVEHFKPKFQLGLTATPDRMDEKQITDHFGKELYSKTLPEAIAEGHLATVNYNVVSDSAVQEAVRNGFNPSNIAEIQRLFEIQPRNEEIVGRIQEVQNKIREEQGVEQVKTIIFCADVEHADGIALMLGGESYHSGKNGKQQNAILQAFRGNNLETITVRDMFNEGVDIPDARLIVFLRTTQSPSIFEQQLGRGLRKNKSKQEVTVLDFVANIERIALIRDISEKIEKLTRHRDNIDGGEVSLTDEFESKLNIRTDQNEFIFSEEIINLLERYNYLVEMTLKKRDWYDSSKEELIEFAKQISPNKALGMFELGELSKVNKFIGYDAIVARFGSLPDFQRACGFEAEDRIKWSELSNTEFINLAKQLSPDAPLNYAKIVELNRERRFAGSELIRSRFGSLPDFQRACGFEVFDFNSMSNEELINLANRISPNKQLGFDDITDLSSKGEFISTTTVKRRFGSLPNFQRACGFDIKEAIQLVDWSTWLNEELIDLAKQLSPDRALKHAEISELSKKRQFPSNDGLVTRFGSLPDFQRACGFEVKKRNDTWGSWSNEQVIELAKQLSPDKALTIIEITALSKEGEFMGPGMLKKRFGTITTFQRACGFEVKERAPLINWSKMTDDEVIELAKRLSPNQPLTHMELETLKKEGKFMSYYSIGKRFGSLPEFHRACGF